MDNDCRFYSNEFHEGLCRTSLQQRSHEEGFSLIAGLRILCALAHAAARSRTHAVCGSPRRLSRPMRPVWFPDLDLASGAPSCVGRASHRLWVVIADASFSAQPCQVRRAFAALRALPFARARTVLALPQSSRLLLQPATARCQPCEVEHEKRHPEQARGPRSEVRHSAPGIRQRRFSGGGCGSGCEVRPKYSGCNAAALRCLPADWRWV